MGFGEFPPFLGFAKFENRVERGLIAFRKMLLQDGRPNCGRRAGIAAEPGAMSRAYSPQRQGAGNLGRRPRRAFSAGCEAWGTMPARE